MRRALAAVLLVCAGAAPAAADGEAVERSDSPPDPPPVLTVHGQLRPELVVVHQPTAADTLAVGAGTSRAGIELAATPYRDLAALLSILIGGERADAVAGVDAIDRDGDGRPDDVALISEAGVGLGIEEASVRWTPHPRFQLAAGRARPPLTQLDLVASADTLMPSRVALSARFTAEPDLGAWVTGRAGPVTVTASTWNGTGRAAAIDEDEQGPLFALRADWGAAPREVDLAGGPLRVGAGAGVAYRASQVDRGGEPWLRRRDLRASAGLQIAVRGAAAGVELLRRQLTDDVNSRSEGITGAYALASYLARPGSAGVAAIGRVGWLRVGEHVAPRTALTVEGALAFYPRAGGARPGDLRLVAGFARDADADTGEISQRAILQACIGW